MFSLNNAVHEALTCKMKPCLRPAGLFIFVTNLACRITYEKDPKVVNAATFVVQREDHTIGNIVRMWVLVILHTINQYSMLFQIVLCHTPYISIQAIGTATLRSRHADCRDLKNWTLYDSLQVWQIYWETVHSKRAMDTRNLQEHNIWWSCSKFKHEKSLSNSNLIAL